MYSPTTHKNKTVRDVLVWFGSVWYGLVWFVFGSILKKTFSHKLRICNFELSTTYKNKTFAVLLVWFGLV